MSNERPSTDEYARPVLAGIILMVIGMSLIGLVDATAKELAQRLSGLQVAWAYFVAMLISLFVVLAVKRKGLRSTWRSARPGLQWLRALSIVGSLSLLFTSMTYLPLAEATVISFVAPLLIVAAAGPVLGEAVSWRRWLAVVLGMCGALLVIRPGSDVFHWAALLPLGSAVCFATFNLVTRAIGDADSIYTSLLYTSAGATLMLCLPLPFVWQTPVTSEWVLTLGFGALGLIAHLLIAKSLQLSPASAVAPINYVRLVWALSIGYFWFGDAPDALSILGGATIVASGLFAVLQTGKA